VSDSSDALIFDNLIWNNSGTGIRVIGADGVRLINNTTYKNAQRGIVVGSAANASINVRLHNNIISQNALGIEVSGSTASFNASYNLNTDGYSGVDAGFRDIFSNPLLIAPSNATTGDGFQLANDLGSTSPAVDAGDPSTDSGLAAILVLRTTRVDRSADQLPVDLGYHYPIPAPTPIFFTPTPQPRTPQPRTPTSVVAATATVTPTTGAEATATPTTGAEATATPTMGAEATATPTTSAEATATTGEGVAATPTPTSPAATETPA
jgi:parallel beta-helix repeat protein